MSEINTHRGCRRAHKQGFIERKEGRLAAERVKARKDLVHNKHITREANGRMFKSRVFLQLEGVTRVMQIRCIPGFIRPIIALQCPKIRNNMAGGGAMRITLRRIVS